MFNMFQSSSSAIAAPHPSRRDSDMSSYLDEEGSRVVTPVQLSDSSTGSRELNLPIHDGPVSPAVSMSNLDFLAMHADGLDHNSPGRDLSRMASPDPAPPLSPISNVPPSRPLTPDGSHMDVAVYGSGDQNNGSPVHAHSSPAVAPIEIPEMQSSSPPLAAPAAPVMRPIGSRRRPPAHPVLEPALLLPRRAIPAPRLMSSLPVPIVFSRPAAISDAELQARAAVAANARRTQFYQNQY